MEIIVVPMVFAIIGAIIVLGFSSSSAVARRRFLHQERMAAIEKGVPLPDDVLADTASDARALATRPSVALHGTIWTAIGVGILLSSQLVRSPHFGNDMAQFLAFLAVWAWPALTVGIGLLIYSFFNRERKS